MNKALLPFLLAACSESSGRSRAQLLEVETTIQNGSSTSIERTSLAYEGSHLAEITRQHNGAPAGSARFTYGAGGIERVEYTDDEGDRAIEQLTYQDGRLVRSRYEIAGVRVDERAVMYGEAGLEEVATTSTSPGAAGTTSLLRFDYDGAGRTTKLTELAGSQTSTTELRYTTDGALERATQFEGGQLRETFTFELDDAGRLSEVADTRNGRYEVTYDDATGLISEVRRSTTSGTTTTQYRYGDGSVAGWTFAPAVPAPQLFDLTGVAFDTVSLLHGDIEIPRDLPRASGTDPDPDPQPTCGFEESTPCDSCVAASCCSEAQLCTVGSACDDYFQCAQPCTTQECVTICGEANPTGRSDFEALASCVQAFCPTSCGT